MRVWISAIFVGALDGNLEFLEATPRWFRAVATARVLPRKREAMPADDPMLAYLVADVKKNTALARVPGRRRGGPFAP